MVTVRSVTPGDAAVWLRMRCELWPDGSEAEHREEIESFFSGEFPRTPWEVLLATNEERRAVGFAELGIWSYAEGCRSTRPWGVNSGCIGPGRSSARLQGEVHYPHA